MLDAGWNRSLMPYSRCPICGRLFHLLIAGDVQEWYAKFAPSKQIGDDVTLECFECWKASGKQEISDGDQYLHKNWDDT
jgi:hypothetical protein